MGDKVKSLEEELRRIRLHKLSVETALKAALIKNKGRKNHQKLKRTTGPVSLDGISSRK